MNAGAPTRDLNVPFTVSAPAGAEVPVRVDVSVDNGAAQPFTLPLNGTERIALGAAAIDGTHRIVARAFDAVGNVAQSEVTIVLDRVGPRVDAEAPGEPTGIDF